jgi:hypothetical protein
MKKTFLAHLFSSVYCVIVFTATFLLAWFLVPHSMLQGWYLLLAVIFTASLALTITCIIRNIKERIALARTYRTSVLGIVAVALGLSALQVCGIAAPICGASIGFGIVASIFPEVFFRFLSQWSVGIIAASIAAQWLSLYFMNCFRPTPRERSRS